MCKIVSNLAGYEYETIALVRSFFPGEEVKMVTPESATKDRELLNAPADMELILEQEDGAVPGDEETMPVITALRLNLSSEPQKSYELAFVKPFDTAERQDRHDLKEVLKLFLYDSLSDYTGESLPWGDLIGIRPTKIAMTMLEEGKEEEEIAAFLKGSHRVSDEKIALAIDIARREKELLDRLHYENGYSLYIGIPFCPTTCLYCSFTSYSIAAWRDRVEDYLNALYREIEYVAAEHGDRILDTLYIGGGTPTSLSAEQMDALLTKLEEKLDLSHLLEFTVEAGRADSITEEKLEVLAKHKVTRISVNPQTMKQATLDLIGRRHTVEQVVEAYETARRIGFDNINMDIILGLPGENEEDVADTIRRITALSPDSLTVHSLAIKRASKLGDWIRQNGIETLSNTDKTMEIARGGAATLNMQPYYLYRQKNISGNFENVGYAREGKFGIYNILIMEEVQTIVACGAGTITKRVYPDGRIERCDNVKDVGLYIEKVEEMIGRKRALFKD